jgi:predicted TIM-barrel fold metal-dependent hydrolase
MGEPLRPSTDERDTAEVVRPDAIDPRGRLTEVIDTDFHFVPPFETLRRYFDEPFKSRLRRYPQVASEYSPDAAIGKMGTGQSVLGEAHTAHDVIRVLDEIGVDIVVLSPGFQRPQNIFSSPTITALARAYNDYLIEEVFPVSNRIKASIMINQRDPDAGAAEIRRVAPAAQFVSAYSEFGGTYKPIGSAQHDPIFDALAAYDLPLSVHVGTFWQPASPLSAGARTWVELLGISPMGTAMACMGSMIMQGLFDKYPRQKVLVQEGGFWWVIDFMLRADEFYLDHPGDVALVERKLEARGNYLNRLPSEYVLEHFRFSTQPMCRPKSSEHMKWLLEIASAENLLLYSSDWPHATFDPINWLFETPALSDSARRAILSGNARSLFSRLNEAAVAQPTADHRATAYAPPV